MFFTVPIITKDNSRSYAVVDRETLNVLSYDGDLKDKDISSIQIQLRHQVDSMSTLFDPEKYKSSKGIYTVVYVGDYLFFFPHIIFKTEPKKPEWSYYKSTKNKYVMIFYQDTIPKDILDTAIEKWEEIGEKSLIDKEYYIEKTYDNLEIIKSIPFPGAEMRYDYTTNKSTFHGTSHVYESPHIQALLIRQRNMTHQYQEDLGWNEYDTYQIRDGLVYVYGNVFTMIHDIKGDHSMIESLRSKWTEKVREQWNERSNLSRITKITFKNVCDES